LSELIFALKSHLGDLKVTEIHNQKDPDLAVAILQQQDVALHAAAVTEWRKRYKSDFRHPKGNLRVAHAVAHAKADLLSPQPSGDGDTI
jgi:hypothetical protein